MDSESSLRLRDVLRFHTLQMIGLTIGAVILVQIFGYHEAVIPNAIEPEINTRLTLEAVQELCLQDQGQLFAHDRAGCALIQSIDHQLEALYAGQQRRFLIGAAWTLIVGLVLIAALIMRMQRLNDFLSQDIERFGSFYAQAVTSRRAIVPNRFRIRECQEQATEANRLLAQTRAAKQRLIDHQERLEQTVRERTQALEEQSRQLAEQNLEWERLASRDHLTGLLNRRSFHEQVERQRLLARRYQSDACLVMFDLDHFKQINDSYGHDMGDWVLKQAAGHLGENQRGSDLFGRWGGEEFVLFLPHTGLDAARAFCERLRIQLAETPMLGGLRVTASFGVTACQRDETLEESIKRADSALYAAKHQGRNRVELA